MLSHRKGFALIELLLVILVVTVIFAVVCLIHRMF